MNGYLALAIVLVIFLCFKIAFDSAPMGYEDSTGFHYGKPKDGR